MATLRSQHRAHLVLFRGTQGKYYFRAVAKNGQITAASQGYARKDSAKRGALRNFPGRPIVDQVLKTQAGA